MAVPGAWRHPKIRATLLLLLVAAGCGKAAPGGEITVPGTGETSRPFGGGLGTTAASAEFTSNTSGPSAEFTSNRSGPSAEFTGNTPGPSAKFTGNRSGPSAEFTSNTPGPSAEFTGNTPGPSAEFTGNTPGPSAEFTGNCSGPSAEFTGNTPGPSAEFTGNCSGPSAEFTGNHSGPSAKFTSNTPGPSAEFTGNRSGPSVHLAVHPPTAAQLIPPTARTLAKEEPVGSVSSLPPTEAAVGLGSSPAGVTAAGGEKPVMGLKPEGPKGQVGPENQTAPGWSGQSESPPGQPTKAEGTDRRGGTRAGPPGTGRPASDPTENPRKDPPLLQVSPSPPPAKGRDPESSAPTPAPPAASPGPSARPLPVGVIAALLVLLGLVLLVLLVVGLQCRRRRRCGSTSFGGGRAGAGEWAGPVSLPEEPGEGQAGDGGQPAGGGEARRPTLTTFFGKRHSRGGSVAMEEVGGAKGEGPLSEPLLATGEPGGDPPPQGAGEANGKVPSMPGPPSPPPDPPANGEFPLPPPMEQEALPPV